MDSVDLEVLKSAIAWGNAGHQNKSGPDPL